MYEGVLKKMQTEGATPIDYFLAIAPGFIHINQCLNQILTVELVGSQCLHCGSQEPIFRQGFCKRCFFESPAVGDWIMRPELSKAHLNIADRDLDYEKEMQLQPHVVYLALSSHLKVGVTRKKQLPTRWIDQGAQEAVVLLEVPNRYLAGVAEVALKEIFSDKTNWRKMVQNESEAVDWSASIAKAIDHLPNDLKPYLHHPVPSPTHLEYPMVGQFPQKPVSLNLHKNPLYSGKLVGVKGQYLLFEDQTVFNVRSNEGLVVRIAIQSN